MRIREGDPSQTTLEQWERFCGGMLELGKRLGIGTYRDIDRLSPVSALVVRALKALGKENIGFSEKRKLPVALTEENKARLLEETQHGLDICRLLLDEVSQQ